MKGAGMKSLFSKSFMIGLLMVHLSLAFSTAAGQNLSLARLNSEFGLSNNMVISIVQDSKGFMWFGTQEGLNRYDGYSMKVYKKSDTDTTTILDNFIHSLFIDSEGDLWVGTLNGLCMYSVEKDQFIRYRFGNEQGESFKRETLGGVTEDNMGNLWYGNQNGGIYRVRKGKAGYRFFDSPSKSISRLFFDKKNNTLIVGTKDCEIYLFNKQENRFIPSNIHLRYLELIPDNYVRNIFINHVGKMVMTSTYGIFEIDPYKGDIRDLGLLPLGFTSFRNNEIRCVYEESPQVIWIGTWGKGLYRHFIQENRTMNYQVEPGNNNSLTNNDVNVIYKDRSGVIWVGTQDGITYIDPAKELFRKYQNNPRDPQSLHFNFITSFCQDKTGNIWIGTYGGGISIYDAKKERFAAMLRNPNSKNTIQNNAIRAICEDYKGNIWIGTMKGLDRYNPEARSFTHFQYNPDNPNSLSNNDVLCIIKGKNNDIWVGTFGGGISHVIFNRDNQLKFEVFKNLPDDTSSLSSNYIRSMKFDRFGNLWIGTLGAGVDKLNVTTGKFEHFSSQAGNKISLLNNNINSIYEARNGKIWIGTWNGLSSLDPDTRVIRNYTVKEGLSDNNIAEIQQDDQGYLWISSHKGIIKAIENSEGKLQIVYYTTENGLQGNKFNINASLKDREGKLYFGGTTGFNVIDPSTIIQNDYVPPVVITNFQVYNKPVRINEKVNGRVLLKKSIDETEQLTLTYKDKIISFEFAALSFSERDRNMYRYMLEGFDKQWVTVDAKRRFASYSNLPRGKYVFKVQAANSDGKWNEAGTSLYIKMLPPPWKTWWAFLLYALITATGLYVVRSFSLKQARLTHKLEIESLERQKTDELNQLKFNFFTNISHEVRTPLTLIIGPVEKLLEDKGLPSHTLDHLYMINKSAKRLMLLVNQLMDFRKIEMGKFSLEFSEVDIVEFVFDIKSAFDVFSKAHNINYLFTSNISDCKVWIDLNKLEMALYNILSNAFKFTKDQGEIRVDIDSTEKARGRNLLKKILENEDEVQKKINPDQPYVILSFSDNGIGIPKDRIPRIFERFYQVNGDYNVRQNLYQTGTGIGLSITREVIEMHQGHIFVESNFGRGTRFTLLIPLGDSHIPANQKVDSETTTHKSLEPEIVTNNPEIQYIQMEESLEKQSQDEKMKVLVIEDNPDIRKFICNAIKDNFQTLESENGADGLEMVRKHLPDLVICDIMMPVMDGQEFCRKLKDDINISHIPVILLTAYNTIQNTIQGYEGGADDFIPKPFNAKLLNVRIFNLIENRRKLREIFSQDLTVNPQKITVTSIDARFLEKAVKVIEEKMDDPDFNVVTFGREMCMSRTNLFRKMKSLTGVSASEFIRNVKIKYAARLLLSGYNVSQAMDKVGISSRSYFNKCFYEHFKKTPSEYIKEYLS